MAHDSIKLNDSAAIGLGCYACGQEVSPNGKHQCNPTAWFKIQQKLEKVQTWLKQTKK